MPAGVSAYTPLANITLSSSASSVTFSSISQAYRDLVLVMELTSSASGPGTTTRINNDSGSNYFFVNMVGNGSTATSASGSATQVAEIGITNTEASTIIHQFMDYSATDKHKTVLTRANRASAATIAVTTRWANTAAITTITYTITGTTLAAGSTFALYGVSA